MVRDSPHVYDNVTVSFKKHNEGRNWRSAEFNHECWLLLLGFPNDYWTERHIHCAVGTFAKVLLFVAEDRYKTRLLLRVRVTNVEKVPQFIVYGDLDTVAGESWTVQVEVLQHLPQADGPPAEDPILVNLNLELGLPFYFYGLGQPVIGQNLDQEQDQNMAGWGEWPVEVQDMG